jgi:protein O-GlcNAc transferase
VQVTYLGYPATTGLPAIDYRLTDAVADPEGEGEFYTEELVRLPDCFLCYQPLRNAPAVKVLPAADRGYITFGSFNNLAKITPEVVALWSDVVKAVPDSRLLIKNPSLTDPNRRAQYYQLFRSHGISDDRVELLGHTPTREEHLALYGRVDIGLDTFPYNGTTTTCEALWMGVPVLTMTGNRHAGRVGKSLLKCIGLDDWVADSPEQFIIRATDLAADLFGLAAMRQGLRDRLAASLLCDSDAFACKVEAAYRGMWRHWCDSGEN